MTRFSHVDRDHGLRDETPHEDPEAPREDPEVPRLHGEAPHEDPEVPRLPDEPQHDMRLRTRIQRFSRGSRGSEFD